MKKILMVLIVIGLFSIGAFADPILDMHNAVSLWSGKEFTKAGVALKAVLPSLIGANASCAQWLIGDCLQTQAKYDEAIAEFNKVELIKDAEPAYIFGAHFSIGCCYEEQGKKTEAQEEYKKSLLIKTDNVGGLKRAVNKVDFALMSQDDADNILIQAYRNCVSLDVAITDEGLNYLAVLVRCMSAKAQANFVK
jgi:tetratricopeptide (TPR) repeat protein